VILHGNIILSIYSCGIITDLAVNPNFPLTVSKIYGKVYELYSFDAAYILAKGASHNVENNRKAFIDSHTPSLGIKSRNFFLGTNNAR